MAPKKVPGPTPKTSSSTANAAAAARYTAMAQATAAGKQVTAIPKKPSGVPSGIKPLTVTPPSTTKTTGDRGAGTPKPDTTKITAEQQRILDLEKQLEESQNRAEDPALQYQRDIQAADRRSAFQILADEFTQRGLPTIAAEVQRFMQEGLGAAEARIAIRNTQAYKERFAGNEGRLKKGLAVYQPNEYLDAEETYRNLLLANNLQDLATRNTTDAFISGAVSPQEVQDRIQNVFNKIDNADPALKGQLGQYFSNYGIVDPNLQRSQLASALLTGETSSMALERQLKKAQLRAGAQMADVTIAETGIESLQKQLEAQGVSDVYGTAKTGFKTLAETQAESQRLAGIYGGEQAPLAEELQQEAFFGLQSQRRKKLQEKEQATFAGQAGTSTVSLGKGTAGAF